MATVTRERELLRELVALVRGECPSLLNEDSGGDVRLSMAIDDALAAPPAEDARDYVAELRECHELLTSCVGGVDPDEHPDLVARINVILGGCDVAGVCPAPVDPVPGSVDYWREVAARLGAEVKLMADALKGTTEQRDDALAKLTTSQAPPASDPPGLVALVKEWADASEAFNSGSDWSMCGREAERGRLYAAEERLLAAILPASPQAQKTPHPLDWCDGSGAQCDGCPACKPPQAEMMPTEGGQ